MSSPTATPPRVFVSHSHSDNEFCRRLVADLRAAGADVWYDEHNLGWGELRREIERQMPTRPYFVVILSPDAVQSDWVNREIDGALDLQPPASVPSARFPKRLADLGFEGRNVGGVEVIVPPLCDVPAGEFLMGGDPDPWPQHQVPLAAYQIARFPVTLAEYARFVQAGQKEPVNWHVQLGKQDHPVVNTSWRDAVAYAAWLAKTTGQPWRLPTEAEWEKAARWDQQARHARNYPWGDRFDKTRCNTQESDIRGTTPVGAYSTGASPCGAQEMAGNVWEWTSSLYKPYPYTSEDGRENQDARDGHVYRGGCWRDSSRYAHGAYRSSDLFSNILFSGSVGFRVACGVPGSTPGH
jgi:formylglycine-generating enzyme required for sulfatase activity